MQMLLPFNSVCPSFVTLRPVGVFSLQSSLGLAPFFYSPSESGSHYSVTSSSTMSVRGRRSQLRSLLQEPRRSKERARQLHPELLQQDVYVLT